MLEKYAENQNIAFNIMRQAIKKKEFSHAYLIETNNYFDADNLVLSFVKEILSLDNDLDYITSAVDNDNYPELKIIEPDGNCIKKEQLTELQEEFNKKALMGNKKIYIIKEADKLNNISANSILKFLEEPVAGIIAILMCDNRNRLLETISSRCQIISLVNKKASLEMDTCDYYTKIGQLVYNNNSHIAAFLEDENKQNKIDTVFNFIKYYERNNVKTLLFINKYWYNTLTTKEDIELGLKIMLNVYLEALNLKLNRDIYLFKEEIELLNLIIESPLDKIATRINAINNAIKKLEYNTNLNLLMDKLIIEMDGCL